MRPFGYRTRFQRVIANASPDFRESLLRSIAKEIDLRSNIGSQVREIRIIRFPYQIQDTSKLKGHFVQPNSTEVNETNIQIIAGYDVAKS